MSDLERYKTALYQIANGADDPMDIAHIALDHPDMEIPCEIPVIKRFSNGRCEDLRLVQEISDAIMSAILKQKPNMPGWRGEGTLDACNAVIDIMERYFQQHSTKRESVEDEVSHSDNCECCQNLLRMEKRYDHLRGFPQDQEAFIHIVKRQISCSSLPEKEGGSANV